MSVLSFFSEKSKHVWIKRVGAAVLLCLGLAWLLSPSRSGAPTVAEMPLSIETARGLLEQTATDRQAACIDSPADQPHTVQQYRFPRDFKPHPDAGSEVWNLYGLLSAENRQQFAFSLRLIRSAIHSCTDDLPDSAWSHRDILVGAVEFHDISGAQLHRAQRVERVAQRLSGAENNVVWVNDWRLDITAATQCSIALELSTAGSAKRLRLKARSALCPISRTDLPVEGLSAYLVPGLEFSGTVDAGQREIVVAGVGWLERSWGSFDLQRGAVIWDRFMLAEPVGDSLRLFSLLRSRRRSGNGRVITSGLIINPDGSTATLEHDQMVLRETKETALFKPDSIAWQLDVAAVNTQAILRPVPGDNVLPQGRNLASGWSGLVSIDFDSTEKNHQGIGYIDIGQ